MSIEKIATIWPEWNIEKQIGKGSFGTVYQAVRQETNVESKAAIKVISIPVDSSEIDSLRSEGLDEEASRTYLKGVVEDFVNEIRMMETFKGIQNIVSVEDFKVIEKEGEIGWDIYIRMELLTPFPVYCQNKKLTEEDVIRLGCDICSALEICGQRNIIHRDIKPENIFVNNFGFFKLGDFGIARQMEHMTAGFSQKGTQNYMAPEVFAGTHYDARVDIYSLGIVLYRLLNANRMPFIDSEQKLMNPNARREALERRISGEELPTPCEASEAMANVILRACAYAPEDRFETAAEMKKALLEVQAGTYQPVPLTRTENAESDLNRTKQVRPAQGEKTDTQMPEPKQNTFGRKKEKWPVVVIILLLIALLGVGAAFAYSKGKEASKETEQEEITPTLMPTSEVTPTETMAPTKTPTPEPVQIVNIPNLYGYTVEDAEVLLLTTSEGFTVVIEEEVYDAAPKGTIISQYPLAGSDALLDTVIKLTLSAGPEPTSTPTPTPEATPTPKATPTPEPTNTPKPTSTPAPTNTPKPTSTPTPTNTPKPTSTPAPTNTPKPTNTPTPTPTPTPVPHVHSFDENYVCESCGYVYYTEGLSYKLHSLGTYYIVTGIGTAKGTEIVIPEEYDGKPVREIANRAFKNQSLVTKLVIPSTIKSIGEEAFENMLSLNEVYFGAVECKNIGSIYGAFHYAGQESDGIKVTIGKEVTRIPAYLFWAYADSYANISTVIFEGEKVKEIGGKAFHYCKNLSEIVLPEGVKTIGDGAFYGCATMRKLTIPSTVQSIGAQAFEYLLSLEEVYFNAEECKNMDNIYYAFEYAGQESDGIKVTIGKEVTRIPVYLFCAYADSYANVSTVIFEGEKVKEIGGKAFHYCKNLSEIVLPEGVKTIGDGAFYGCASARKLTIPSTVQSIGAQAFECLLSLEEVYFNAKECKNLDNIYYAFEYAGQESDGIKVIIGKEVTRIPAYLFCAYADSYVNVISVVYEGTNVTVIGSYAFGYCKKMQEVIIPSSVKTISSYAFANCLELTSVTFEDPYNWYKGSTYIEEFYDSASAATILTSTYVRETIKKE